MKKVFKIGCLGVIGLFVLIIALALLTTDSDPDNANKDVTNSAAKIDKSNVPEYEIQEENIQGSIWNVVLLTATTDEKQITELIKHTATLAEAKSEKIDAIFAKVNIKDSLAKSYAAAGKVALSDFGLAQTGLNKVNDFEIDINLDEEHLTTKDDLVQSDVPYSSQDILEAFQAAGLPTTDARDNSHNCISLECTSVITTEDVSIYEWPSEEIAKQVHTEKGFGDAQVGTIIIRMNNKNLELNDYVDVLKNFTQK